MGEYTHLFFLKEKVKRLQGKRRIRTYLIFREPHFAANPPLTSSFFMRPALPEEKFKSELVHVLTRYMGWEAVMRIRVSRGWKITKFDGHLFIRGQDLLVVPNCHQDQTFAIQIDMEDERSERDVGMI